MESEVGTIAGALGTLLTAIFIAWKGYKDKQKEEDSNEVVAAGVIQDNASIRDNTAQLIALNVNIARMVDGLDGVEEQMRLNHAALTRLADIEIMLGKRRE